MISATLCPTCGFGIDDPVMVGGREYCRVCAPAVSELPPIEPGTVALRPYQEEAVASVFEKLADSDKTLVVQPTGTGKTILFAEVIRRWPEGRVLVVAHRDELIQQAAKKIQWVTGEECDIEMGDRYADQCSIYRRSRVLVTSVQTMSRPRRHERFNPEDFGLLVYDEAHHAVAPTGQAVINRFRENPKLKVLGVTATPDRADEAALGRVFESVAYDYQLVQAIDDGWLVPIEQQFIHVDGLDLSNVKTTAGDLNLGQVSKIVEQEKVLHGYAWPTIQIAAGRQTLVFTASVDQAESLSDIFNRHEPGCSEWICGDGVKTPMETRRDTLKRFSEGKFQFLVNCAVLLEGYDEPNIRVVAVARPTKSRCLYAQIVGRGTRPLAGVVDGIAEATGRRIAIQASEKQALTVLDFVGNSGRHKLMHTGDLLGGDFSEDIVAAATRAVQSKNSKGERADMLAELRAAEQRKREEAHKRAHVTAQAKFRSVSIDPFAAWDLLPKREPGWHKGRKPTPKMLAYLTKLGVKTAGLTFCEAGQIISEANKRREKGLATYKQSKLLIKHGFSADVSFSDASAIINRIAKSGWTLRNEQPAELPF